jgi:hypothetical protein
MAKTYIFNVGNGNFSVSVDGQDMVIQDAGRGRGSPPQAYGFFAGANGANLEPGSGLEAFGKIIENNKITNVRTLISHQHNDHMNLLPSLFRMVSHINQKRKLNPSMFALSPIKIGKFYIGGNVVDGQRADQILRGVANFVGKIDVEYIGNNNPFHESPITRKKYQYTPHGRIEATRIIAPRALKNRDISFNFGNDLSSNMSIITPSAFDQTTNNLNDTNLVAVLRNRATDRNFLFTGDATTGLLRRIQNREKSRVFLKQRSLMEQQQIMPRIDAMLIPHHMSNTGDQSVEWTREAKRRAPFGSRLFAFGSSIKADSEISPLFKTPHANLKLFCTTDLDHDLAFSLSFQNTGARIKKHDFIQRRVAEFDRWSQFPFSWKMKGLMDSRGSFFQRHIAAFRDSKRNIFWNKNADRAEIIEKIQENPFEPERVASTQMDQNYVNALAKALRQAVSRKHYSYWPKRTGNRYIWW